MKPKTRQYVVDCCSITANMLDGMGVSSADRVSKKRWEKVVTEGWGQGFVELTMFLAEMAMFSQDDLNKRKPQDWPGVYVYEVSYDFGQWLASLLALGIIPDNAACHKWILNAHDEFFEQGEAK